MSFLTTVEVVIGQFGKGDVDQYNAQRAQKPEGQRFDWVPRLGEFLRQSEVPRAFLLARQRHLPGKESLFMSFRSLLVRKQLHKL